MSELDAIQFLDQQPRCACVLLLDTSGSMSTDRLEGKSPIDALNEGLQIFCDELLKDELAMKRVEVAIVSFNSNVNVVQDFVQAKDFQAPTLSASGATAMGKGIEEAINLVKTRKQKYKDNGITFYRPWIFMITDGAPTDSISQATVEIREGEENKSFMFFAVGVQGANMQKLTSLSVREPLKLEGLKFGELFEWLSASMQQISTSNPGDQLAMPPRSGWEQIET